MGVRVRRPAVAGRDRAAHLAANRRADESTLGILGGMGDDVDDPIDGVRPPDRATGTANHLDALDVGKGNVVVLPEHAGKGGGAIDGAAIHQDQKLVGETGIEAANADRPFVLTDGGDLHTGSQGAIPPECW